MELKCIEYFVSGARESDVVASGYELRLYYTVSYNKLDLCWERGVDRFMDIQQFLHGYLRYSMSLCFFSGICVCKSLHFVKFVGDYTWVCSMSSFCCHFPRSLLLNGPQRS